MHTVSMLFFYLYICFLVILFCLSLSFIYFLLLYWSTANKVEYITYITWFEEVAFRHLDYFGLNVQFSCCLLIDIRRVFASGLVFDLKNEPVCTVKRCVENPPRDWQRLILQLTSASNVIDVNSTAARQYCLCLSLPHTRWLVTAVNPYTPACAISRRRRRQYMDHPARKPIGHVHTVLTAWMWRERSHQSVTSSKQAPQCLYK